MKTILFEDHFMTKCFEVVVLLLELESLFLFINGFCVIGGLSLCKY